MKKLNSVLMLAMMMIAAVSFTACGDDDDDNGDGGNGGGNDYALKFTIDGKVTEYDKDALSVWDRLGDWSTYSSYNRMSMTILPITADLTFRFPTSITPSTFIVGYGNFANDATRIELGLSNQRCTYVSGTATVTSNDGAKFTVKFNGFKLTWNNRELIIDGTVPFYVN